MTTFRPSRVILAPSREPNKLLLFIKYPSLRYFAESNQNQAKTGKVRKIGRDHFLVIY